LLGAVGDLNLVAFRGRVLGVPQHLGQLDLEAIDLADFPDIIVGDSEAAVVAARPDRPDDTLLIEESYRGYNLIRVAQTVVAVRQSLGSIDFAEPLDRLAARLGVADFMIGDAVDGLRESIDHVLGPRSTRNLLPRRFRTQGHRGDRRAGGKVDDE